MDLRVEASSMLVLLWNIPCVCVIQGLIHCVYVLCRVCDPFAMNYASHVVCQFYLALLLVFLPCLFRIPAFAISVPHSLLPFSLSILCRHLRVVVVQPRARQDLLIAGGILAPIPCFW